MKMRKIIIMFILFILIFMPTVMAQGPDVTATSAVVIDCIDDKVLYEHNMEQKLYPANLTKVMTAIIVAENCNLEDKVTVTQEAISRVEQGYLTANIKAGETFSVEQLLHLLLISAYNDVSNVLAEHIAGSEEEFVALMNKKAEEIGCKNTNFTNSSGEHDTNHYSTAYDMALIGKYAMKIETIKNMVSEREYVLPATDIYTKSDRVYHATNEMLLSNSKNYYKYAKGLKTGFTTPSGFCLIAYSEKNDLPLIATVMKSTTSDSRYEDAENILEYAYKNNTIKTIAQLGTIVQTINVKKANKATKKLNIVLQNTIQAVVKVDTDVRNIEPQIELNKNIKAPIKKGDIVGKVSYTVEGKTYETNLIAESEVKKSKTGITFLLIFVGLLVLFGGLRVRVIYKRNKTLKKIRGK